MTVASRLQGVANPGRSQRRGYNIFSDPARKPARYYVVLMGSGSESVTSPYAKAWSNTEIGDVSPERPEPASYFWQYPMGKTAPEQTDYLITPDFSTSKKDLDAGMRRRQEEAPLYDPILDASVIAGRKIGWELYVSDLYPIEEPRKNAIVERFYGYERSVSELVRDYWARRSRDFVSSYSEITGATDKELRWEHSIEERDKSIGKAFDVSAVSPREMVEFLIHAHQEDESWLEAVSEHLNRCLPATSLARALQVWNVNEEEAARIFNVNSKTVREWLERGFPSDIAQAASDIGAATDLLVRHLKRDRIPAVVRRGIERYDGRSLMDMLMNGDTEEILAICRRMFEFEAVNG